MPAARRIELVLRIDGDPLPVSAPQPPARGRLDELLPAMQAIDNAAIGHAIRKAEAAGKQVTCAKGCSACCRAQPVPVTPPEAHALLLLVEAMPTPRRREVEARFADRVARLRDAGLADGFLHRDPALDADGARTLARDYFALGLVCPFLQDDACSIHPQRPFVCRQYLVTSDPALCADPFANPVEVVPMPVQAATAMLSAASQAMATPQHTVPLTLALEHARAHREALRQRVDAEPVFRHWLRALASD
ncbi:YkgJ family cysteine cluster protein [Thermomonas sp.]|uniref:YkgJ family cysteine cluster protein n=1 Tax=Thermomonas sp. TaxID=1971895 RepID=UPI0035B02961